MDTFKVLSTIIAWVIIILGWVLVGVGYSNIAFWLFIISLILSIYNLNHKHNEL